MTAVSGINRNRFVYAAAVLIVIAAGLASRKYPGLFPASFGKYPGDALWALMVLLILGWARPRWPSVAIAALALFISLCVEFSQLYQAPWINSIRQSTLGHLVLGSTFNWYDLIAYAVGVLVGYLAEVAYYRPQKAAAPYSTNLEWLSVSSRQNQLFKRVARVRMPQPANYVPLFTVLLPLLVLCGCGQRDTPPMLEPLAKGLAEAWPKATHDLEMTIRADAGPEGVVLRCVLTNTSAEPIHLNESALPWVTPGLFSVNAVNAAGTVFYRHPIVSQIMNDLQTVRLDVGKSLTGEFDFEYFPITSIPGSEDVLLLWSYGIEKASGDIYFLSGTTLLKARRSEPRG